MILYYFLDGRARGLDNHSSRYHLNQPFKDHMTLGRFMPCLPDPWSREGLIVATGRRKQATREPCSLLGLCSSYSLSNCRVLAMGAIQFSPSRALQQAIDQTSLQWKNSCSTVLHMAREAKTTKVRNQSLLWVPLERQSNIKQYKTKWPTLGEMQVYQFSEACKQLSGPLVEWYKTRNETSGSKVSLTKVHCFLPLSSWLGCVNKAVALCSLRDRFLRMDTQLLMLHFLVIVSNVTVFLK